MAFQPLSPELRQRALQIAGSYNGNNTAPMKRAASALEKAGRKGDTELVHVTPGELSLLETIGSGTTNPVTGLREFFRGDQQSKDVEGRDSQEADGPPGSGTGPGDTAATTGGDVGDRDERDGGDDRDYEEALADALRDPNVDLNEALDIVDREFGGDGDERAPTTAAPAPREEGGAAPIATTQASGVAQLAEEIGVTARPEIAEQLLAERAERIAREAAVAKAAAQAAAQEPKSVTEEALEQATTPVDFFDPGTPAQRGGLYSSALAPTQPTYLQDTALNNLMGGPTPSVSPPTPVEYTEKDLAKAREELASAQFATPPAFGAAAGKPRISQMGIVGGIADAIFNPEASLANAISERGIGSIDGAPTGREGGLEVVTADGRTAAYDPERNIVFDSDPFQGVNPFGDERVPEGIQALYDKKRAVDELQRDNGDREDREPITEEEVAVEEEIIPEKPPTIDIVPFRPQDFYYFTPGSFAYNRGIPSMMNMRRG